MAAPAAAMTVLVRLLENICFTPVVVAVDIRYRRPRWKCGGESRDAGRRVVQRGLTANVPANRPQGNAKVTGPAIPSGNYQEGN
jgi:hypothetical protein